MSTLFRYCTENEIKHLETRGHINPCSLPIPHDYKFLLNDELRSQVPAWISRRHCFAFLDYPFPLSWVLNEEYPNLFAKLCRYVIHHGMKDAKPDDLVRILEFESPKYAYVVDYAFSEDASHKDITVDMLRNIKLPRGNDRTLADHLDFLDQPAIIHSTRHIFCYAYGLFGYINSKVPVKDYQDDYRLPEVIIKGRIESSLVKTIYTITLEELIRLVSPIDRDFERKII